MNYCTDAYQAAISHYRSVSPVRVDNAIKQIEAVSSAIGGLADQCAANLLRDLLRCAASRQSEVAERWLSEIKHAVV